MVVTDSEPYVAVDWGTTNRRAYLIEDGMPLSSEWDDRGAASVTDFAGETARLRARFGDLPILLAGMVGSTIGWCAVPYVATPAGINDLADAVHWIESRTAIVPGLCHTDGTRVDVMRGEEVQLLGAVTAGLAPANALLVQPGTHCKWAEMKDGRITGFTTAMTGELFAMLRSHSLLAEALHAEVENGHAFREGLEEGRHRDLGASLFAVRAASVLGSRPDADAASYTSGVLIGSDVAARLANTDHIEVHVLADQKLGELYGTAIEAMGRSAILVDSHAAFGAGVDAIAERIL